MFRPVSLQVFTACAAGGVAIASFAIAATPATEGSSTTPAADQLIICKIVADDRPTAPWELCLTKAEWGAKATGDAQDANRIICHYEEEPGTRLHGRKICMPASEWALQRQSDRQTIEHIQMQSCVPGGGC